MKRKITAILAADVVGYSRLVAEDEEETLQRLASYRTVFDDFISRSGGRIFNTAGDSVLAEFPSAVEMTRCAIDIQEAMRGRNAALPQNRRMDFRMGLTIGDVVERDGDLLGDAVNVAARLEGLAEPGGICVSQAVYESVANKVGVQFQDLGEQEVKNIPRPVHAFRIGHGGQSVGRPPALELPGKAGQDKTAPEKTAPEKASQGKPGAFSPGLILAGLAALLLAGAVWLSLRDGTDKPESPRQSSILRPAEPAQVVITPPITEPPKTPAPPLPAAPAEAFKVLAERGGIVEDPKSAPEFYHNARSFEIRGDANAARRAYAAFAGLKLNMIDPLLRYAALLRVQEGRAGARETLSDLVREHPTPAALAVHAMQFDGADRRARLEKFVAEHPAFTPARFMLAEEYGEDRLGSQQTLSDRRSELENLTLFLNADRQGTLQPFFMDHSVLADWTDRARKRFASLESFMKTATTTPVVSFMRHNTGWNANISLAEAATEIAWRLKPEDEFRSTATMPNIDPRTGKPMPLPYFELPADLEKADLQIRYRDAAGQWVGPFDIPFEWQAALVAAQRQILDQFKTSWVAFRNEPPYDNLLYFTHLVSYRCAIAKALVGYDDGPVTNELKLPACDRKNPMAVPNSFTPYLRMPAGVRAVTVRLTYADGREAEPVIIRR